MIRRHDSIRKTTIALAAAAALAAPAALHAAPGCSTALVRGDYSVVCTGHAAGPMEVLLPAAGLGTATFDGAGGVIDGSIEVSLGGVIVTQVITGGVGSVAQDCTAEVELDVEVGGVPTQPVVMRGVVLDRGDRIRAFSRVPGTAAVCTLERIRQGGGLGPNGRGPGNF